MERLHRIAANRNRSRFRPDRFQEKQRKEIKQAMLAICGGEPLRKAPFPGWPFTGEKDRAMLAETVRSGKWGGKERHREFEARFAADTGVRHVFAVANGTVSLELILRGMGVGRGDEVVLPPYTFIATLSSVVFAGAAPVFADIDPLTYNISPFTLEEKITPRTKAVVAVAVAGCPPDLDALTEICSRRGIGLVVDAAQAVGAAWREKSILRWGSAVSVSCQNSKNLTCGEGGIIATEDDGLAEKIRLMLSGGEKDGKIVCAAEDHNISEFQASLLLSQYEKLADEQYLREKNAAYLAGRLGALPFVRPAAYDARITRHGWHLFLMMLNGEALACRGLDRGRFIEAVNAEGIPLCAGYAPLYAFPCASSVLTEKMTGRRIELSPLPNCERVAREGVWLYQSLLLGSRSDMDDIADAMIKVWDHADELTGIPYGKEGA